MRRSLPRRRRKPIPRSWLWLLLPAVLLLTSPMPLPRSVAEALRSPAARAAGLGAVPTARIELGAATTPPTQIANEAQAAPPAASATLPTTLDPSPAAAAPPTAVIVSGATELPTLALPTAVPEQPSATLPPPLLIVTSPPAPPATNEPVAGLPTLMPTMPAAPAAPPAVPVNGPAAAPGVPLYIPTLMYHYVRIVDEYSDPLGFNLSVTPQHLEEQLDWIAQRGYTTVTMNTLVRCLNGGSVEQPCPAQPVALTFDDGYEDAFTAALPALQRRGMIATFYIVGNFVGQPGYMNWEQIRALQSAGMEIGSHSMSHPDLTTLDWGTARAEVFDSKALIEANIGQTVNSFCYPSGRFNDSIAALVQEAGYTNATTTMNELPQSNLMLLPRLRVDGHYGLGEFQGLVP